MLSSEWRSSWMVNPITDVKITYVTMDGMKWKNKEAAAIHDRALMRKRYYENEMKNRNWFMRLFNIKPSMKFYDSIR